MKSAYKRHAVSNIVIFFLFVVFSQASITLADCLGANRSEVFLYAVCGFVPLAGGAVALFRVLSDREFTWSISAIAAIGVAALLFRMPAEQVIPLFGAPVLLVFAESFLILSRWDNRGGILGGMAKNRKFLALLCFWSIVPLTVSQIMGAFLATDGGSFGNKLLAIVNTVSIPVVFLTLPFFQIIEHRMTGGGLVGTGLLYGLTMLLSVCGYNSIRFTPEIFVIPYTVGYGIVLVLGGLSWLSNNQKEN